MNATYHTCVKAKATLLSSQDIKLFLQTFPTLQVFHSWAHNNRMNGVQDKRNEESINFPWNSMKKGLLNWVTNVYNTLLKFLSLFSHETRGWSQKLLHSCSPLLSQSFSFHKGMGHASRTVVFTGCKTMKLQSTWSRVESKHPSQILGIIWVWFW